MRKDKSKLDRRELIAGLSSGVAVVGSSEAHAAVVAPDPASDRWDEEADVVVVGFGGAGACAAIEAHDAKANVLILEKQPQAAHYPNTRMSAGMFHVPDRTGDRSALKEYAKAMMSGENVPGKLEGEQPDVSDALAEAWARLCPENLEFMQSVDPDFKVQRRGGAAYPDFPGASRSKYRVFMSTYTGEGNPTSASTKDKPRLEKTNGEAFFQCLRTGIAKREIRVSYDTPGKRLITGPSGEVIGVVAERSGGAIRIMAKRAVVITSGGYEYSRSMRRAFLEGPGVEGWAFAGTPANTGDGIEMALRVGAGLSKPAKAEGAIIMAVPIRFHGLKAGFLISGLGAAGSLVVSNYGKRYANESHAATNPIDYVFFKKAVELDIVKMDYPNVPSWMIFDENFRSSRSFAVMTLSTIGYGMVPWSKDNMDAVERGWILTGQTIGELASKIRSHPENRALFDPSSLVQTVARFNEGCVKGVDDDFGRKVGAEDGVVKPPFYAAPLYPGGPNTSGGLAANADRWVLDWQGKPIPRLFTAGEISSVHKFAYQGGGNLSECIVFGRVAGQRAAALQAWA